MYVFYTRRFDGKLQVQSSPHKPGRRLEGRQPMHVQEVTDPRHVGLPLDQLRVLYPPADDG